MKNPKNNKKMVIAMITKDGIAKTWVDPKWYKEKQSKEGKR